MCKHGHNVSDLLKVSALCKCLSYVYSMLNNACVKGCCNVGQSNMKKLHGYCAAPYKIAASTDQNCENESKNRMKTKIRKVRVFLQHDFLVCWTIVGK